MTTPTPENAEMPSLLPCAYCGSKRSVRPCALSKTAYYVDCDNDKCPDKEIAYSPEEAVRLGNVRATDAAGLLSALEEIANHPEFDHSIFGAKAIAQEALQAHKKRGEKS